MTYLFIFLIVNCRIKAEEAAELADHNLNMFRRKQQELEEMEARLKEGNEVLQKLQKK